MRKHIISTTFLMFYLLFPLTAQSQTNTGAGASTPSPNQPLNPTNTPGLPNNGIPPQNTTIDKTPTTPGSQPTQLNQSTQRKPLILDRNKNQSGTTPQNPSLPSSPGTNNK